MNRMFTLGVLAVLSASVYAAGGSMNGMDHDAGRKHSNGSARRGCKGRREVGRHEIGEGDDQP